MSTEGTIELYHGMASTCSKKVRMCLYEKGVGFESHLLDLQKFEQHRPDYLAINPNGVVPTLVHNGRPILESSIIIDYIDDCYPDPALKPADNFQRAQMRLWMKFSDDVAYKAVFAPTWQKLRHRAEAVLKSDKLGDTLANVPTAERRARWEKMSQDGYSEAELDAAYDQMKLCLDRAEAQLTRTAWLASETFSLADIAMLPFVDRIQNLRPELLGPQYWHLTDWLARCRARPSFSSAFAFKDDPRAAELPNF